MDFLGKKQTGRLVRLNKECPDDIDGIVDTVRGILLSGSVQSLVLKNGEPISYERMMMPGEETLPRDSTESFAELTPFEVIRNVPMEEFSYEEFNDDDATPHEKVMWAFMYLEQKWRVSHILLHPDTKLWKWLDFGKAMVRDMNYLLGARVEWDRLVPDDVYILCGARTRHATIAEIECSIKCIAG